MSILLNDGTPIAERYAGFYSKCREGWDNGGAIANAKGLATLIEELSVAEHYERRFREALVRVAAFDDTAAGERLHATGSYSLFDEPGSVEIARTTLAGESQ